MANNQFLIEWLDGDPGKVLVSWNVVKDDEQVVSRACVEYKASPARLRHYQQLVDRWSYMSEIERETDLFFLKAWIAEKQKAIDAWENNSDRLLTTQEANEHLLTEQQAADNFFGSLEDYHGSKRVGASLLNAPRSSAVN
jgi:hypothetical protein